MRQIKLQTESGERLIAGQSLREARLAVETEKARSAQAIAQANSHAKAKDAEAANNAQIIRQLNDQLQGLQMSLKTAQASQASTATLHQQLELAKVALEEIYSINH